MPHCSVLFYTSLVGGLRIQLFARGKCYSRIGDERFWNPCLFKYNFGSVNNIKLLRKSFQNKRHSREAADEKRAWGLVSTPRRCARGKNLVLGESCVPTYLGTCEEKSSITLAKPRMSEGSKCFLLRQEAIGSSCGRKPMLPPAEGSNCFLCGRKQLLPPGEGILRKEAVASSCGREQVLPPAEELRNPMV